MTTSLSFAGAKGGVGTSTVAALVALAASQDRKVFLDGDTDDLCALLGVPKDIGITQVSESLYVGSYGAAVKDVDLIVRDLGTLDHPRDAVPYGSSAYLVTRLCYLALRRALADGVEDFTGIILLNEAGRSLGKRDVEGVLGKPVVATLDVTESTARTIDAGLLAYRPPVSKTLAALVPALVTA